MRPTDPAQRVRRWHTYLVVWRIHRVLGLGLGALIVVLSATGSLLVMHHALERTVAAAPHVILPQTEAVRPPLLDLVKAVAAEAPVGYRPFRLMPPTQPDEALKVMFVAPDARTRWSALVHPHTGQLLWKGADLDLFTPWLLALHMHLHLGGWGYVITGLAGVALLGLGLSGLYLHRRTWRHLWRPCRLGRGARVAAGDLHQWLGLASIYFSLVLGATGTIYAATIAPGQIRAARPAPSPLPIDRLGPIEPMIAAARARFPDGELLRVSFPASTRAPATLLILHRSAPVWQKFSRCEFNPATAELRAVHDASQAPWRTQFSSMLAPLHFGFYGPAWVKWLYVAGGFAPALLGFTGAAIWWLRRQPDRRAPTANPPA